MTLDVRDVDVELGGAQILDAVSATVQDGRLVGVVGPNGAGKSTLLRAMNGIVEPEAGTVLVDDQAVHDLPSKATSRRIASVPQDSHIGFEFTVRETVEMGRHAHVPRFGTDPDPDAVDRAMERANVARFADRDITSLSGGEKQRVLLARALAQETPVLLLDEPTASLDVNHQVRTLELVRSLADDAERAVVAAIHDLDMAARYCDELVLVADGRVLDSGDPAAVLTPAAVREAFDARVAVGTDPVTGAQTVTPLPAATGGLDASVHVLGGGDSASRLLAALADAGATVTLGPVADGSLDHETAARLGIEVVTTEPFSDPDLDTVSRPRSLVAAADAVVVPAAATEWGANGRLQATADAVIVVDDGVDETQAIDDGELGPPDVDAPAVRVAVDGLVSAVQALDVAPERFAVADGGEE